MAINQNYVKAFRYGMMFGKDIRPGTARVCMSVVDAGDILLAVKKAYIDMSPRTFKPEDREKKDISLGDKESLLKEIAQRIQSYMVSGLAPNQTFDDWHKELCNYFVGKLRKLLSDANKKCAGATFGKAQKIVNMTFKYMYCFDDADKYANKFEPCHMPLDSYILDWFFTKFKKTWEQQNSGKKLTKSGTYHLPVWSDLKYEKDTNNGEIIPQYKEIQDWIETRLGKVSRLEAEFVIWYEARNGIRPYTY